MAPKPKVKDPPALLRKIGERVRSLRQARGLTLRSLAEQSALSDRFLSDLEGGKANISVLNLAEVARTLGVTVSSLLADAEGQARPEVVALLGLRGAGKTTVGRALADTLDVPFFELDRLVESEAGMSLSELFAIHGEAYYRQIELAALRRFLTHHRRGVLATGGGLVTNAPAYSLLRERTQTVWLKATPDEHWDRVVKQGDLRPIANQPHAMVDLKRRLREREPLYSQAELTLSTTGKTVPEVVAAIARKVASE